MEDFIEIIITWLDILKNLTEFDYKIITHREGYLFLRIDIDNKKFNIEVHQVG